MKLCNSKWLWIILAGFLTAGLFYPFIGVIALICMLAPVVYGYIKGGRIWCGCFCPRGNLLGKVIGKASLKGKIPTLLKNKYFQYLFMALLLSYFGIGVYLAWGDLNLVGGVFVRTVLITTIAAIILGIIYQPRTWCAICPMGTLANLAIKQKACSNQQNESGGM